MWWLRMISTVDKEIKVIYPLDFTEEEIQGQIQEIKELDLTQFNSIKLLNDDIALSLLFYFKELITNIDLDITLYVRESVFEKLTKNFKEIFDINKLKVYYE